MKTFLNSSALAFTLCSLARCVVDGAAIPVAHTNSDSSTVPCLISNGTKPTREFTAKGVFSGGIVYREGRWVWNSAAELD
ncbi:hypothetical protein C8J57DRAFT_1342665, partial [Mycena rebaudengoi]